MRIITIVARKLIAGVLALVFSTSTATVVKAKDIAQAITIQRVHGLARYSTDQVTWLPLRRGDVLQPGSLLKTEPESSIDLCMGDPLTVNGAEQVEVSHANAAMPGLETGLGLKALNDTGFKISTLHVYPGTVIGVVKLKCEDTGVDQVQDFRLDLHSGRILGDVKKLSAASRYEIKLPIGVAGIRGTVYTLSEKGEVCCFSGSVVINYVDGEKITRTKIVSAGMNFSPYRAPITGEPVPVSGAGYVAPIPPQLLGDLQAAYSGPQKSPAAVFTPNQITVYISPN